MNHYIIRLLQTELQKNFLKYLKGSPHYISSKNRRNPISEPNAMNPIWIDDLKNYITEKHVQNIEIKNQC